jgi:hypothetical protein
MHNATLIRQICGEINRETDEPKTEELLRLLKSVILNDFEDARVRIGFIRRKYAIAFEKLTTVDIPERES